MWRSYNFKVIFFENQTRTIAYHFFSYLKISVSADENDSEGEDEDDRERENAELKKYQELVSQGKAGTLPTSEVEKYAGDAEEDASKKDKVFERFLRVTKRAPKQVVRYSRGGKPLWVSDKEIVENVPNCEFCNGPRIFEFQIMPQLLARFVFTNFASKRKNRRGWRHPLLK